MDVMQDKNLENTANPVEVPVSQEDISKMQPIKFAFPAEDYNQNGKLKTVRGRMLKKLLKYEFKSIMSIFILVGTVLVFALLSGISLRFLDESKPTFIGICGIIGAFIYILSSMGALFVAWIIPVQRYDNNFFKGEGYLTFSIPASMEEHVLAKRISATVSLLVANIGTFVGVILFGAILDPAGFFGGFGGIFVSISENYGGAILPTVLFVLEIILFCLVSLPLLPCLLGALQCSVHKYSEKKKNALMVLVTMGVVYGLSILTVILGVLGVFDFLAAVIGMEGMLFITILLIAGLEILCMWYELRTLKKKLNLR